MTDNFYRAFEDKHRGSRETILSRLQIYQPFLKPLLTISPTSQAVDLGCGRGEWLEYVTSLGFSATGVDLDEGMLSSCEALGLKADKGELLEYLRSLESESVVLVSAFHVVEHIEFDDLRTLVQEALRVLEPGGLLIMETPNPENIIVASHHFYMDPTHKNPIPPQLLSFLTLTEGFTRSKTLRLQEAKELVQKENVSLHEVFSGVSPDYAILTQKEATPELLSEFDFSFEKEYGLSLNELLNRWDRRFAQVEKNGEKAQSAAVSAAQIEARVAQVEARVVEIETRASQAEANALAERSNVEALKNSTSWKVTAPMRLVSTYATAFKQVSYRNHIKRLLQHLALYVNRRPRLKRLLWKLLDRFPSLKSRLFAAIHTQVAVLYPKPQSVPALLTNLTPRARQIYYDLKVASEKVHKESP